MDFQVGHAIYYDGGNPRYSYYGVVVDVNESEVELVHVNYKKQYVRCYDEPGADYQKHRNNVQLKNCPHPFTSLSRGFHGMVYANADMEHPVVLKKDDLNKYQIRILERGTKVPNADMKKIFNHPWEDQLQKQKTMRSKRRCGLNIVWDDESEKEKDEGMEF